MIVAVSVRYLCPSSSVPVMRHGTISSDMLHTSWREPCCVAHGPIFQDVCLLAARQEA